jgi:alpha-beta hydrolase superfamily lysophospholipase
MKDGEGFFQGVGGAKLYYQCWWSEKDPLAVLGIIHGFGEHSGRYMNVVTYLTFHGYKLYGFDHRGHGRSPGQRGHINHWGDYRGDVRAFLQMIIKQEPGRPMFLLGHSMGALIVLDYILRDPEGLRGAITSGAPIKLVVDKPWRVTLARLLSQILPRISFSIGLDKSALSRDPEVIKTYEEDPVVHGVATARWSTELFATIEWVKTHADEVRIPILMVHGEADRLSLSEGTCSFYEEVPFSDKELQIYPGGYHESHNDLDHERVTKDIRQWLERHL